MTMPMADKILVALMRRIMERKDACAFPWGTWSDERNKETDLTGDRIHLAEKDAKPLVDAGLLLHVTNGTICYRLTQAGIRQALTFIDDYKMLDIDGLLDWCLERALFHPHPALDGQVAIPALYTRGTGRIVLVLGENAAGKSMFRRIVLAGTHRGARGEYGDPAIPVGPFPVQEVIHLSMQGRTSGSMGASFVYGAESYRSTGENSARTVTTGISTALGRAATEILYWDEPDIGMSSGAAAGAGIAIREFVESQPPLIQAVFVTSHSPALIRQLVSLDPHYVYLGDANGPKNLDEWFVQQQNPKPIALADLNTIARERFQRIQKVLNAGEGKRKAGKGKSK